MSRNVDPFTDIVHRYMVAGGDTTVGERNERGPISHLDILRSLVSELICSRVPISRYVPERRELPPRVLPVATAWKGIESILGDLIRQFRVGRRRCLEFGVEFGYSTAALSS